MKEIFDIRRFGALAWKFYRENAKTILIFLGVMIVVTFVVECGFNPFKTEYKALDGVYDEARYFGNFAGKFAGMFWGLLGMFSIFVAGYSFKEVMSKKKASSVLLLPASSFEKMLLATLNATVVVVLLHLAVFYATANIACSFKYGAYNQSSVESFTISWVGHKVPVLKEGEKWIRPEVGNVFWFVRKMSLKSAIRVDGESKDGVEIKVEKVYFTPFLLWNLLIVCWTYFVFVFMWGAITFRKHSALLTVLLHVCCFLLLGWLTYEAGEAWCWNVPREEWSLYGLNFYTSKLSPELLSPYWLLLSYVFPLTYLGIIWKKFTTKQV